MVTCQTRTGWRKQAPPEAACRPGTSGSSPASGPSLLLCRPGTLADTCREEVQNWQEVGSARRVPQCKKPSESGIGFHYSSVLCSGPWLNSSEELNSSLWVSQLGGLAWALTQRVSNSFSERPCSHSCLV